MVNTGRPSRGCDPCKVRHTKCDERRPQCSRCKRAGRVCTGYKNDFDRNHRNETRVVAQRVRAHNNYFKSLQNRLSIPYGQHAVGVFLENFVLNPPQAGYSSGYLTRLLPLLRTTTPDSLLSSAVEAVGLCFLATNSGNETIASSAASGYLRCLNCLQTGLQDVSSISIETMISVYLMGLYEMMMPPENSVHPWLAHFQGLTALVKARINKTGCCFAGINSFVALDPFLDISSWTMNHNSSVDEWFIDRSAADKRLPADESITRDTSMSCQALNIQSISDSLDRLVLRAQPIIRAAPSLLENSYPDGKERVQRLLTATRSQLSSFRAWSSTIPGYWQPKTLQQQISVSEISHLGLFPGRVDIYYDLYVAAMWNTYRTVFLQICDLIVHFGRYLETAHAPFQETEEYRTILAETQSLCEGICSSVAYHINNDWLGRITCASFHPSPKALGGLLLIWPLYAGSILSIVPAQNRAWMRRKLRSVGISTGLAQAVVLADTVDLQGRPDLFKPLIIGHGNVFIRSASTF